MRLPWLLITLVLATACSTGQAVQKTPAIAVKQVSDVSMIQVRTSTPVPVDYSIEITNPLDEDLTLTSLEIETVGESGGYSMKRVRHTFSLMVKARETTALAIRAWVVPLQQNDRGDVTGMVNLRGVATFRASSGVVRAPFATRVQ